MRVAGFPACNLQLPTAQFRISKETFYDWLKKAAKLEKEGAAGRKQLTAEEAMLVEFSDAIKKAMAMAEVHDLELIQRAAKAGHWQAAAWRLERRYPQKWGRRIRAEISEPDDKPIQPGTEMVDLEKLTPEKLTQLQSILESAMSSEPAQTGNGC